MDAINRACQLVEELGCGEVVDGIADASAPLSELRQIPFEPERINAMLGTDVSVDEMLEIFKRLELAYDENTKMLTIPSFRTGSGGRIIL